MTASIFAGLPNDIIIRIIRQGQQEEEKIQGAKEVYSTCLPKRYHATGSNYGMRLLDQPRKVYYRGLMRGRGVDPHSVQEAHLPEEWRYGYEDTEDGRHLSKPAKHRKIHKKILADKDKIQEKSKFKLLKQILDTVPCAQTRQEFLADSRGGESQVPTAVQWEWGTLWNRTVMYSKQRPKPCCPAAAAWAAGVRPKLMWRTQKNVPRIPGGGLKRRILLNAAGPKQIGGPPKIKKSKAAWKILGPK
tara:strand:+ start:33 stop:770 length:738 start_codon:yes stop_codon:yes gene_type:complete